LSHGFNIFAKKEFVRTRKKEELVLSTQWPLNPPSTASWRLSFSSCTLQADSVLH